MVQSKEVIQAITKGIEKLKEHGFLKVGRFSQVFYEINNNIIEFYFETYSKSQNLNIIQSIGYIAL